MSSNTSEVPVYDFLSIESKWRDQWETDEVHRIDENSSSPSYYCLDMFPYPSGSGLHVGHWRGYVLSDVYTRYKTIQGFQVLHPMGWDSFGLPAENDAILKNIHPRINTQKNIENMKRQLQEIGAMYDWSREINTSSPEYYRWTQWIFVKMFKKGLAYRKMMPINWCPNCKTGLANEEVEGGTCERCGAEVTKKDLLQWMLKITEYADRLLEDLDKLEWPDKVKTMQANWIGRSEGAQVVFSAIQATDGKQVDLPVYTTRPDTLFGATYMVLAPEHPDLQAIAAPDRWPELEAYRERARLTSDMDRQAVTREKTGLFTGAYAVNPVNGEKIPIWISDYVLVSYGTGAIMAVPAHDTRDFEFAKTFDLPIIEVIHNDDAVFDENGNLAEAYVGEGVLVNSGTFDGTDSVQARAAITENLQKKNKAQFKVNYRLRDWVFSRQRYWGEPIPIVHCPNCGEVPVPEEELPVLLPEVESYRPTGTGESPLAAIQDWVNVDCPTCGGPGQRETNTMPQWAGSSWYFLRYPSPQYDQGPFQKEAVQKWCPVDLYVGGVEHAILHLLYARFFTKFLHDIEVIPFDEPFLRLFNQGMICREGAKMSKSKGNVVNPDELVEQYGTDTVRIYELFVGPPELDSEWNDQGVTGVYRFLRKTWEFVLRNKNAGTEVSDRVLKRRHRLASEITDRLEQFRFNTAISAFMEYVNDVDGWTKEGDAVDKASLEWLTILLGPFAPHVSEELWERLGHEQSLFSEAEWPQFEEAYLQEDLVEIPVQINGKLRGTVELDVEASEEEARKAAMDLESVKRATEGKQIVKMIYVPGKVLNLVVR